MTDISACGRIVFHIPWYPDCVSLIPSRFRNVIFTFVFDSTYESWQKTKTLILTTTNNSRGNVNIHCIANLLISFLWQFQLILCIYSPSLIPPGKMYIPRICHLATRYNTRYNTSTINNSCNRCLVSTMAQL